MKITNSFSNNLNVQYIEFHWDENPLNSADTSQSSPYLNFNQPSVWCGAPLNEFEPTRYVIMYLHNPF